MAKKEISEKKIKIRRIIAAVLAVVLVVYVFCVTVVHFISYKNSEIQTEVAVKETVYKKIETKCFVLRDEAYIKSNASGTTVSFAVNGQRIAAGDTVSIVFDSQEDAATYLKMNEIEKDIESYEEIAGQADIDISNIDSLTKKIDNELYDFLDGVDSGSYGKALEKAANYSGSVTSKQIATGQKVDVSDKLDDLRSQLSDFKSVSSNYKKISAKNSGYFVNGVDGYEKTLDFKKLDKITVSNIENAIESEPEESPSGVIGRCVGSFKWYVLCVVDKQETVSLSYDKEYYLNFPYEGIERLPVKLERIIDRDAERVGLVFCCDRMNEDLSDLRIEDVEIITDEFTGLRIPNTAIRTDDKGQKGVYIVRGHLMGFRTIDIVYPGEEYSLVEKPKDAEHSYIKLYDIVVKEGVDLYDDKLV